VRFVPAPALDGVHHTKIPVSDLALSLAWYERVLGAVRRPEFDHHTNSGEVYAHILEVPGLDHVVELRKAPKAAAALAGFDPVTYSVATRADLGKWIEHLDALGVGNSGELLGIVGWLLVFQDPDKAVIRIYTAEQHEFDENADVASPWLALSPDDVSVAAGKNPMPLSSG
jgi:catechol 2,3-dioxygenase-like lactoylglutathione lyase family enzyme